MLEVRKLTFAVETFDQVYADIQPLLKSHWLEIAADKEVMKLNPDEDFYARLKSDEMLIVTARDGRKICGYFVWFLHHHPHYKHLLTAQSDIYYLLEEYRGGGRGQDLFQAAMDLAKAAGAGYCFISTKVGHDHPDLMKRLGLKPRDLIYGRPL
jgi:GNAT superfamily N-acetyltransferase